MSPKNILPIVLLIFTFALLAHGQGELPVKLPLHSGSVRFAVIGDSGTGTKEQYEVGQKLEAYRQTVKFDFVIMLGDNIYGGHEPDDF